MRKDEFARKERRGGEMNLNAIIWYKFLLACLVVVSTEYKCVIIKEIALRGKKKKEGGGYKREVNGKKNSQFVSKRA